MNIQYTPIQLLGMYYAYIIPVLQIYRTRIYDRHIYTFILPLTVMSYRTTPHRNNVAAETLYSCSIPALQVLAGINRDQLVLFSSLVDVTHADLVAQTTQGDCVCVCV